jgi:hypothetical protein
MANPTRYGKSFWLNQIIIKRHFSGSVSEIKRVKENISSFLGTLIFLTALYYFLEFCADYYFNGTYSTFFGRYASTMPTQTLIIWFVSYIGSLYIITKFGELVLEECEPIVQEDVPIIEKYTSYFQE